MKETRKISVLLIIAFALLCFYQTPYVQSAVSQVIGIALKKGVHSSEFFLVPPVTFEYSTVRDAAQSSHSRLNDGGAIVSSYIYNGNIGGLPLERATVGNNFYAVKRTDITTVSVSFDFTDAFISKKISIVTPSTNTDEICVDWNGGTAVCPAANTPGDDRIPAGTTILLDDFVSKWVGDSISVIAASGTQTVYIRAWQ
jgi:hypothetical protein